jgi:hypothetical protein
LLWPQAPLINDYLSAINQGFLKDGTGWALRPLFTCIREYDDDSELEGALREGSPGDCERPERELADRGSDRIGQEQ